MSDLRSPPPTLRGLGPAVFLLSTSLLSFEVVLLRLFAVETFSHLTYMAVGIALLGMAASGTILVVGRRWVAGIELPLMEVLFATSPLALLAAPVLAHLPRYDPTQLLWNPGQWTALAAVYVSLALPFLVGGGAIVLALGVQGERVGRIYAWNMAGSGVGTLLALALLSLFRPDRALAATALPAAMAAAGALHGRVGSKGRAVGAWAMMAAAAVATWAPPWGLDVTDFKALPQVELFPQARRTGESWAATGWAVAVQAPAVRHAPGLSLAFRGTIPRQIALFVDGESAGAAGAEPVGEPSSSFLSWLPSAACYAAGAPGSVLVLGSGGGTEVSGALAHGAERVTAVELVKPLIRLARESGPAVGGAYTDPRVDVVVGDARSFLARTGDRFDRVILPPAGVFNATASGILSPGEDFLNTTEAYRAYLQRLAPGGILSVTRWQRTPPRDNVKVILTMAQALRDLGLVDVGGRLAFVRSWATGTLLVKPDGFTDEELHRIRSFARERYFDVDWPPASRPLPPYNTLEEPVFEAAIRAAVSGSGAADAFVDAFPFDVTPPTDDRPYFGRFLPLGSLVSLVRQGPGAWLPVAEWGTLAVVATLLQSGVLALILMGLPVLILVRGPDRQRLPVSRVAAYFVTIGLGYLFVEMAAIQRLALVLGHPVYAAAGTLGALLVFSGAGSALSDRIDPGRVAASCLAVAAAAAALAGMAPVVSSAMSLPLAARTTLALTPVMAAGLLMGMPFPLGLRRLALAPEGIAWAWAANGVASVMGAALATLLAMQIGTRGLILCGAASYGVAALTARGLEIGWSGGATGAPGARSPGSVSEAPCDGGGPGTRGDA